MAAAIRKRTPQKAISKGVQDPVERYARDVLSGTIVAGPLVRAACERHLRDLRDGPGRGLVWDAASAARAIGFFPDVLRLAEGEHADKPFSLQPFQQFIVGSLFGWKGSDGYRRFRTAYVEIGKGNGKSPLAGGIGLLMLAADREASAEVYAAATTRDQARILFRDAVQMVDASPALTKRIQKSGIREVLNLAHMASGSYFRPISSEGRGLDGKRVHCALIDEVHEHPSAVVVDKMRAGTKGRRQALIVEITNSGVDRTTICYQHHEYSERVVQGLVADDSWFAFVCGLDPDDDPFEDESCWIKANPNLGVSITRKYLEEQVREAKGMPAKASIVRRLNFCQWVDAANPAIPGDLWRSCEVDDFDEGALAGLRCVGGLDLSGSRDLTALARAYEPDDDGIIHAIVEFWTPKDTLVDRARQDRVPYDLWVSQGYAIAPPGRAVDYKFVAQRLSELQSEVGLTEVAFDPYRIKYLEPELADAAVYLTLVPHGQGFRQAVDSGLWMPRSLELLEDLIGSGKLRVKKNPALTFAAASAVHQPDPKGNLIYDKRRSTGRIDGLVALAMAVGALMSGDDDNRSRSIYEDGRDLLVI
jgi:phage terminase large subunit-like protein